MAIVTPKTEKAESYKTPGVPEDAHRDIPEELEELFERSLPQEKVDEPVFDKLAKDPDEEPEFC